MDKYTTKQVRDFCYNCDQDQPFTSTYLKGQRVETFCNYCGEVDSFPYDDED